MKRVEFRLSMPRNNSWDGKWSGAGHNHTIVRSMHDDAADKLLGDRGAKSWSYNFGDGWVASVSARIVPAGERLAESDGFCGYGWMVESIVSDGDIYGPAKPNPKLETVGASR